MRGEDGQVTGIYCHWDGGPEDAGALLLAHYREREQVAGLVALGDVSQLGEPGAVVAYGRDKGEGCRPPVVVDGPERLADATGGEWVYVWEAGRWRCWRVVWSGNCAGDGAARLEELAGFGGAAVPLRRLVLSVGGGRDVLGIVREWGAADAVIRDAAARLATDHEHVGYRIEWEDGDVWTGEAEIDMPPADGDFAEQLALRFGFFLGFQDGAFSAEEAAIARGTVYASTCAAAVALAAGGHELPPGTERERGRWVPGPDFAGELAAGQRVECSGRAGLVVQVSPGAWAKVAFSAAVEKWDLSHFRRPGCRVRTGEALAGADEIASAVASASAACAAELARRDAAAAARARELAELPGRFPHLETVEAFQARRGDRWPSRKCGLANLRKVLAQKFPGVGFSVRQERGTAANWSRVGKRQAAAIGRRRA